MVSLREKAIKAAKEHEERIKKSKQKAAEKFAEEAKVSLKKPLTKWYPMWNQ